MDYTFEFVKCNICGSDNYYEISNKGQFGLPANVVICKECGLVYLNPRWDSDSYLDFYKHKYDNYYRPRLTTNNPSKGKPKNHVNPILKRIEELGLVPEKINNILDIGSGEGENLIDFGARYPDSKLYAIEPSQKSQKYLKISDINLITDDVNADWEEDYVGMFDIIIMRHVLEHFLNPVMILKKVRKVLSEKGILYVAVPNNLNPTQNLQNSWFRVVHTYYFNRYSLANILTISNLMALKIVEGDDSNSGEVFLIAKQSTGKNLLSTSKEHYVIQKDKFISILKKENKFINKVLTRPRRILKKLISLANK